ncbi:immune inhibitor A domain-containing protein [Brevibacillus sp. H7]|uniref:immune inhibitor A domain-containing protein n=1 Tax=Brevibacillus sp. H7 TaxID=3349138 RepID=UPI0037F17AB3
MKKSRKLLSILFSTALVATPLFAQPDAGAAKSKSKEDKHEQHVDLATINYDRLVNALKDRGKIDKNADPDEIEEAVKEFLEDRHVPHGIDQSTSFGQKAFKNQQSALQKTSREVSKLKDEKQLRSSKRLHTDNIVVALIEFSDKEHNELPKANDSVWTKDFNQKHYENMLFNRKGYKTPEGTSMTTMAKYYYEQSGYTWTVDGVVTPWLQAENDHKYYGGNDEYGNDAHPRELVKETLEAVGEAIQGKEDEYDQRDPYDIDGDGNLMEPDGLLDNLMIVHSGVGEETGEDDDAIWSHRWTIGRPVEIPGTSLKAYDYMIQPEDGASGVFVHEYGHNLGLPDLYDTIGSGKGSPVGSWSVMSSGSWNGKILGTEPTGFDPWSKLMLQEMYGGNWIKPVVIDHEDLDKRKKSVTISDASSISKYNKVVKINMPQVEKEPPIQPKDGDYSYFSDEGDDLNTKMVSEIIDLTGASSASMEFDSWRKIETGYDYLYVNVIDAETGDRKEVQVWDDETDGWEKEEISLNEFVGKKIQVEFNYVTDGGLALPGFYLDNFEVIADGETIFSDDGEGTPKFELDGFIHFDGEGKLFDAYYLVELRSYEGVDKGLEHYRRNDTFFAYDRGMVVWYYDGRYGKTADNHTGEHPGYGMLGVVDAHQRVHYWDNDEGNEAKIAGDRYQVNDAAFSFDKTSGIKLDYIFGTMDYGPLKGVSVFYDGNDYSLPEVPEIGKVLPQLGLQFKLKKVGKNYTDATIEFSKRD